jgi:hypothetical protein
MGTAFWLALPRSAIIPGTMMFVKNSILSELERLLIASENLLADPTLPTCRVAFLQEAKECSRALRILFWAYSTERDIWCSHLFSHVDATVILLSRGPTGERACEVAIAFRARFICDLCGLLVSLLRGGWIRPRTGLTRVPTDELASACKRAP